MQCKDCRRSDKMLTLPGPRCKSCHDSAASRRAAQMHARQIRNNYGMDIETYNLMFEMQGGVCAICLEPEKDGKKLAVDHDHRCCPETPACGRCNRKLLCFICNTSLGRAERSSDPVAHAERLVQYLKEIYS